MSRILIVCATVVALIACALPVRADDTILLVYRIDARGPDTVFRTGFSGRGSRMDLLAHTLGGACDETDPALASMWVSTSGEQSEALGFAYDYLSSRPSSPDNRMWLYVIRPDLTYMHVPSVIQQAAAAGQAVRLGYTQDHARVLNDLVENSLIATEQEVVTHYVAPANIISASPVWFDGNDELTFGPVQANPAYQDLHSSALTQVADINAFVPPASIRLGLLDNDGSESGSDSDQCTMSCDGAGTAASSLAAMSVHPSLEGLCHDTPKRTVTPMLMDVMLGN